MTTSWTSSGSIFGATYGASFAPYGASYVVSVTPQGATYDIIENGQTVTPQPPTNTVAPAVTGTPTIGQTLSCTTGTWASDTTATYTYQWKRDNVAISAATSSTYVLVNADFAADIKCVVTATNTGGATDATSNSKGPIAEVAPVNTVIPAISGTAKVGQTLTSSTGTWTSVSTPTYAYQWKRAGSAIVGATSSTYVAVSADYNNAITVTVTATNTAGSASATSNGTTPVTEANPVNTVAPAATGRVFFGTTLSTTNGTWTSETTPTYTYQWKRNGSNITSATSSTYSVVTADEGQNITCAVTATNTSGATSATSNTLADPIPTSILSNLRAWVDFSDTSKISVTGALINSVTDKSSNAYSLTASGTNRTTLTSNVKNGRSAALFVRANKTYVMGNIGADLTSVSIYMYVYANGRTLYDCLISSNSFPTGQITWEIGTAATQLNWWVSGTGSVANTGANTFNGTTWHKVIMTYTSGDGKIYIDGTALGTTSVTGAFIRGTNFCIGSDAAGAGGFGSFDGYILETVVQAGVSTSQERTDMATYFTNKWG